jgi:hypothetical protein
LAHKSTQDEYLTGKCKDWVNAQGFDIWKVLVSASLRWYLERSSWYLSKNLRLYKMIIFTKRYKRILSLWQLFYARRTSKWKKVYCALDF